MENKKAQALDDDLLENIIGGISLRGVFRHACRDCQNVWYNEQGTSACPRCGSGLNRTRGFSIAGGWDWSDVEVSSPERTDKSMNQ